MLWMCADLYVGKRRALEPVRGRGGVPGVHVQVSGVGVAASERLGTRSRTRNTIT